MTRSLVGAGVAVSVPATGALLSAAPASASMPSAPTTTPKSGSADGAAQPRLAYGSTGSAVQALQARVGVAADGNFGPLTMAAVKRFQSSHGLVPDGIVGPLTWGKLGSVKISVTSTSSNGSSKSTPAKPVVKSTTGAMACSSSATTLRYGTSGQLVKILQSRLGVDVDGFFGSMTQQAVVSFQNGHGLTADGVVSSATWAKLGCTGPSAPVTTTGAKTTTTKTVPTKATPAPSSSSPSTTSISGSGIVAMAERYVGVPYVWGGMTPSGFDCSGLTSYVYKQFGVSIPRTAAQQQAFARSVSTPQPGDLIFFGSPAYHVGIYVGNGLMIDAAHPGSLVSVHSIYGSPAGYGRII